LNTALLNIVFLNVNGLGRRASKLELILKDYEDKDVICLCETWLNDDVASSLSYDQFDVYYSNRPITRRARRSSGGLLCLVNKRLKNCVTVINNTHVDILWLKLDNIGNLNPICLGLVYISPEDSSWHAISNIDLHRVIARQIGYYHDQEYDCLVVGDFNGRTGILPDYVEHDNNSIHLPLDNQYTVDVGDMPPRHSEDSIVNNFGHALLDMCKVSGVHIVNGRYFNDRHQGLHTCHTSNGGHSVVDYLLCTTHSTASILSGFEVGDMTTLSADHCPLLFAVSSHGVMGDLQYWWNEACNQKRLVFRHHIQV